MAEAYPGAMASLERHREQASAVDDALKIHNASRSTETVVLDPRKIEAEVRAVMYPQLKAKLERQKAHGTYDERRKASLELALGARFLSGKALLRNLDYSEVAVDEDGTVRVLEDGLSRTLKGITLDIQTPDRQPTETEIFQEQQRQEAHERMLADGEEMRRSAEKGESWVKKHARHADLHNQDGPSHRVILPDGAA